MRTWFAILLLCCLPLTALAEGRPTINCNALERSRLNDNNVFLAVHERAKQANKKICLGIQDIFEDGAPLAGRTPEEKLQQSLIAFGTFATKAIKDKVPKEVFWISPNENASQANYANFLANFDEMQEQLAHTRLGTNSKWPDFRTSSVVLDPKLYLGYFATNVDTTQFKFLVDHPRCNETAGKSCKEIFNDFEEAFKTYRQAYVDYTNSTNKELLADLNRDWDRFLEVSKSQTVLEVWLTTLWHNDYFKQDYLVGPPSSEVIALHPQVVYEYVEKVTDDNNAEFGLAVEWFGLNWWDLKVPFGASIASVYTDRMGVNDFGTGIMLHIDNKYSVGWSRHGDEDGFYFSLDLLKLFDDKKQQYERYIH